MKRIAVIPIDNRPICYTLLEQICAIDKDIELFMPKREFLGGLQNPADITAILTWLENLKDIDILIISLDTVTYGGLISSRRCTETFDEIMLRIDKLTEIISAKKCEVLAFSSIMRISNNNINEEEKEYWNIWGKKIFDYSYFSHKARVQMSENCVENKIPQNILKDYSKGRKRNFEVNLHYLKLLEQNIFNFLIFSKDDCAKYGWNIEEAEILNKEIKNRNLNGVVKTGADEIPLSLLTRAILSVKNNLKKIKIAPYFEKPKSVNLISKYEDLAVFDCVKGQIELAGALINEKNPDLTLFVNNFEFQQGDNVLGDVVNNFDKDFKMPTMPYFIADINNANGADNNFVNSMLKTGLADNFYGYCAYNTSANTLGCAIAVAITKFQAENYDDFAFRKLQFIRLMDDYAYQANIRKEGGNFAAFEKSVNDFLKTDFKNVKYSYPWKRSFEIEVTV